MEAATERAREAGVVGLVTIGTDLPTSRTAASMADELASVWAAVGVHPYDAALVDDAALAELRALAGRERVVAIGEIGLDYHREGSDRAAQQDAFGRQLTLAAELGAAVVIHMRDAHDDVFAMLAESGPPERLVFHCFSGGPTEVRRALDLGGYVSFAGNVSYRSAGDLREAAAVVPLDRLLVETDSPYLAPVPHRGRPNEPALVAVVGAAIAEATGRPVEDISTATVANSAAVLRLGFGSPSDVSTPR